MYSAQSIIKTDLNSVKKHTEENLLEAAEKYMFKKRFLLKENYDKHKLKFYSLLNDILNTENCDLIELLENTIEGDILKLENKNLSPISQYNISFEELYNRWILQGNTGNFDYFLNTLVNNGVTLEKNGWD